MTCWWHLIYTGSIAIRSKRLIYVKICISHNRNIYYYVVICDNQKVKDSFLIKQIVYAHLSIQDWKFWDLQDWWIQIITIFWPSKELKFVSDICSYLLPFKVLISFKIHIEYQIVRGENTHRLKVIKIHI